MRALLTDEERLEPEGERLETDLARLAALNKSLRARRATQQAAPVPDRILTGVDRRARVLIEHPFGSREWAEMVFGAEPSQEPYRRGRAAERGVVMLADCVHITEGHERIALYVLEQLMLSGTIKRIKSQPFSWLLPRTSHPRTPDFLIELRDGRLVIIEVKAERYVTREREARFEDERRNAATGDVDFLVWTDRSFLTAPIRNLFTRLRGSRALQYNDGEVESVAQALLSVGGQTTIGQLSTSGIEPALVCRAIRSGHAFVSLYEDLHVDSLTSIHPITDERRFLFDRGYHSSNWWSAMQDRQAQRKLT